jgi:hypothetical protein
MIRLFVAALTMPLWFPIMLIGFAYVEATEMWRDYVSGNN